MEEATTKCQTIPMWKFTDKITQHIVVFGQCLQNQRLQMIFILPVALFACLLKNKKLYPHNNDIFLRYIFGKFSSWVVCGDLIVDSSIYSRVALGG